MTDPFRFERQALISFSGGRTSAFMLHSILQAYEGVLPEDVVVTFANTGKEREETLRFVRDCAEHWDVNVRWLEYFDEPPFWREVTFETASRNGEPFDALIARKQILPNPLMRYCTTHLKVRTMERFCRWLGWTHWDNAVGLRHDEGHRCLKAYARNATKKERFTTLLPLDKARITKRDVMEFWTRQNFDLALKPHEGNCDLCFLKGESKLMEIMRADPASAQWWIKHEQASLARQGKRNGTVGAPWRKYGAALYADLLHASQTQQDLFDFDDEEHDAECGAWCAP